MVSIVVPYFGFYDISFHVAFFDCYFMPKPELPSVKEVQLVVPEREQAAHLLNAGSKFIIHYT